MFHNVLLESPSRFGSMRIIETANALEKTKERLFPESKHRSPRIRKKLVRRYGAEFRMKPTAWIANGDTLIVHPVLASEIRKQIAVQRDALTSAALHGGKIVANGETRAYQTAKHEGWWKYGRGVFNGELVGIYAERNWLKFTGS